MELQELLQFVKDYDLCDDPSDVQFLFPTFQTPKTIQSKEDLITEAITWSYQNDKLKDFYEEHADLLISSGKIESILECEIIDTSSIRTRTTFSLYRFKSLNSFVYYIDGDGEYVDSWGELGIYSVTGKSSEDEVLSQFKAQCFNVFTIDGEMDYDELIEGGSSIEFYPDN